ncbi:unnamed protein product [Cochlearia groenlandica]
MHTFQNSHSYFLSNWCDCDVRIQRFSDDEEDDGIGEDDRRNNEESELDFRRRRVIDEYQRDPRSIGISEA